MSKITSQGKLREGLRIIDEELAPSSAGLVSDRGMHIPDIDLIDAKNTLPTLYGYTSFFGVVDTLEDVGNQLVENTQEILVYKTLHGDTIQIAFCEEGLYIRSMVGDAVGTLTNVPAAGDDPEYDKLDFNQKKCKWTKVLTTTPISPWKLWTYALLENSLYVFQKGMNFIIKITSYEPEQVIFEHLPSAYLAADRKIHTFTYTSEDDSTGDDTYKEIVITTDTGLNFGKQRIAVDTAADVANAIDAWEAAFFNTGLFTTKFTETLRTEVPIDAFIPINNQANAAAIQTIIDGIFHDGVADELTLTAIWES